MRVEVVTPEDYMGDVIGGKIQSPKKSIQSKNMAN
jgi:translation elongation factor EF-G